MFRICLVVLGSVILLISAHTNASAQVFGKEGRERLKGLSNDWEELCGITDCDQFPDGYATYAFGPTVYYFPLFSTMTVKPPNVFAGGIKPGRFIEWEDRERGIAKRSFSNALGLIIGSCCHYLLTFYGLAEDFPEFNEGIDGNRMPGAFTKITPYYEPGPLNTHIEGIPSESVELNSVIGEDHASYNDDFWLLSTGVYEENGQTTFRLLSKRPLLNGRHVRVECEPLCTFSTVSFLGDADETRPHVTLNWLRLTRGDMFLCSPEAMAEDCVPAPEIFDEVPRMFGIIEDMFEAATVHPNERD